MPSKPISISLSPNTERDDVQLAYRLLFAPDSWKEGSSCAELEGLMREYLGADETFSFNSGRSALYALLYSFGISSGDEVLLQAFTCNAVANPILWTGASPVYVDCREEYTMDLQDLKRKVSPKSKAVIVQHTFGKTAALEEISSFCKEHGLFLIEDCAHALGASYKGVRAGAFGDASFFSFGRDKVISCVYGGMAVSHRKEISERMRRFHEECPMPSSFWTLQQLLHPVLMNAFILPFYPFAGKYFLELAKRAGALSRAVSSQEKKGERPSVFPAKLPNALARLALFQWSKLERYNTHRNTLAEVYFRELSSSQFILPEREEGHIFLRFPVRHKRAQELLQRARTRNVLLGDWYDTPVAPYDTDLETMHYIKGSCPRAESLGEEILNLPTHVGISEGDARKVCALLFALEKGAR